MVAFLTLAQLLSTILEKKRWDAVSKNGKKLGTLAADPVVGVSQDVFYAKFSFVEQDRPIVVEGRLGLDGSESVFVDGKKMPKGRFGVKPLATVTGMPPKGRAKLAIFLVFGGDDDRTEYRFDVTLATT